MTMDLPRDRDQLIDAMNVIGAESYRLRAALGDLVDALRSRDDEKIRSALDRAADVLGRV